MKNIVIIPKDKIKVLTSCDRFPANGYFTFEKEDAEVKQVPETMEELGKKASDLAIEKRCKMRYMEGNDGSFFVCKDGEMYLFEETREMTVDRLYHKLIWLLGE